jgi:hypothetical protein
MKFRIQDSETNYQAFERCICTALTLRTEIIFFIKPLSYLIWRQSYYQNFVLKKTKNSLKIIDGALPQTVHSNGSLIPSKVTPCQEI